MLPSPRHPFLSYLYILSSPPNLSLSTLLRLCRAVNQRNDVQNFHLKSKIAYDSERYSPSIRSQFNEYLKPLFFKHRPERRNEANGSVNRNSASNSFANKHSSLSRQRQQEKEVDPRLIESYNRKKYLRMEQRERERERSRGVVPLSRQEIIEIEILAVAAGKQQR